MDNFLKPEIVEVLLKVPEFAQYCEFVADKIDELNRNDDLEGTKEVVGEAVLIRKTALLVLKEILQPMAKHQSIDRAFNRKEYEM